jgi:4-amino-4-deoxy-L-arabinose transferase-like glycosyltransferase
MSKHFRQEHGGRSAKNNSPQPLREGPKWHPWAGAGSLAVVVFTVYLLTLYPGVDRGDSAELQYACPLLGVCHPPGYQIEVTIGYLFSKLPLGGQMAWRINLMMAVCGTIGALALYGTVRRITGQVSAGLVGAGALAFSSMYWAHSTVAEVYVFYGMFLLLALYALQRFIETNKAPWLYLGAACLGVAVADRSSELFILPAFLLLWWAYRTKVRLTWPKVALAAVVFVLPFIFTVSSYLVHQDPSRLACRDDAIRDQVLRGEAAFPKTPTAKLISAVRYCLGLKWIENATQPHNDLKADTTRYALQLSGLNLLKKQNDAMTPALRLEEGAGVGIGLPGLILVLAATWTWRRHRGWVLLGWGIFAGNLAFYLWHHTWDGLTFTVPGLVALSLLAGLGAGTAGLWNKTMWLRTAIPFLIPVFLLLANYPLLDRTTPKDLTRMAEFQKIAAAPLPHNAVVITTYWPAMTLRYLYHLQLGRTDIEVMSTTAQEMPKLLAYFWHQTHQEVFCLAGYFSNSSASLQQLLLHQTPPPILQAGLVRLVELGNFPMQTPATDPN